MKAKLFDALYGVGDPPDPETVRKAAYRFVSGGDGRVLIKALKPCLRPVYSASNGYMAAYMEGRRSVLTDIIRYALEAEQGE
jgi:hypothetical protein